tara:strand:- start:1059 stop:1292 length:234 start_codon:yes stop_codon:yes gene_type:complete
MIEKQYNNIVDKSYLGVGFNNINPTSTKEVVVKDSDIKEDDIKVFIIKTTAFSKVKQVLAKAIKTVVDFFKKLLRNK